MEICHPNYEPIKFENESQIIYLRPHNINGTKFSCNWAFIGPKEYGFKFVIREAHKDLNLTVTTSSGYDVIKGYGIRENQAYYNPDNFLNISVDGNKDDFEAYVTFVKNHYNVGDANCSLTKDIKTRGLIWTNIRDIAYPTNSECKNEVPLSNDEFVILKIVKFQAEPFADYIEITDNWDKKHYINHHNPTSW
uniref:CUB domain-containing protein n=1 Tax=Panagrolaimus davidi TaxID=227884 RepID=A0A914QXP4_9BILA